MKFAFSANAFRQYSFPETVEAISAAGYAGIEIMCDTPHAFPDHLSADDIEVIKTSLERNHLAISNLNAFMTCAIGDFHHPSWIEVDEAYREKRVQYTLGCIDLAAQLGVRTISTQPGGPLNGMPRNRALDLFMEGLAAVLPRANEKNVTVLIEPEPDLLIQTTCEFTAFMSDFGMSGLGLNLDIGHLYCVGEDPIEKISQLKDLIGHFHLEDIPPDRSHQHIMLGSGGIDIPGVLKAIEGIDYQGFVTVELYPYENDAPAAARQAKAYLADVCGYV